MLQTLKCASYYTDELQCTANAIRKKYFQRKLEAKQQCQKEMYAFYIQSAQNRKVVVSVVTDMPLRKECASLLITVYGKDQVRRVQRHNTTKHKAIGS